VNPFLYQTTEYSSALEFPGARSVELRNGLYEKGVHSLTFDGFSRKVVSPLREEIVYVNIDSWISGVESGQT